MGKIKVAIIGVGNCASSLIQGVTFYRDADRHEQVPGLMHVDLGGYHVGDIEFTAAFDIDANKVGRDLSEAIRVAPNNTIKFSEVPQLRNRNLISCAFGLGMSFREASATRNLRVVGLAGAESLEILRFAQNDLAQVN